MYKIGDFSYIVNLPVITIRLYDELGILCPSGYNFESGYSYYTIDDINRCKKIQKLVLAGFTLEEIRKNKGNLSDYQLLEKKKQLLQLNPLPVDAIKNIDQLRYILKGVNL